MSEKYSKLPSELPSQQVHKKTTSSINKKALFFSALLIALVVYYWYPTAPNYKNFIRPTVYKGADHVTAIACVDHVTPSSSCNYNKYEISQFVLHTIFRTREDESRLNMLMMKAHKTVVRLIIKEASGCVTPNSCPHLLAALFDSFESFNGGLPDAQCMSARDTSGNGLSFVWGTNFEQVEDTECGLDVVGEQCYSVDERLNGV